MGCCSSAPVAPVVTLDISMIRDNQAPASGTTLQVTHVGRRALRKRADKSEATDARDFSSNGRVAYTLYTPPRGHGIKKGWGTQLVTSTSMQQPMCGVEVVWAKAMPIYTCFTPDRSEVLFGAVKRSNDELGIVLRPRQPGSRYLVLNIKTRVLTYPDPASLLGRQPGRAQPIRPPYVCAHFDGRDIRVRAGVDQVLVVALQAVLTKIDHMKTWAKCASIPLIFVPAPAKGGMRLAFMAAKFVVGHSRVKEMGIDTASSVLLQYYLGADVQSAIGTTMADPALQQQALLVAGPKHSGQTQKHTLPNGLKASHPRNGKASKKNGVNTRLE